VGRVLAGEVRPFGVHTVAIDAVAGCADRGLTRSGFRGSDHGTATGSRGGGCGSAFRGGDTGKAQDRAQQDGGERHGKSSLNHGLAAPWKAMIERRFSMTFAAILLCTGL